MMIGRIEGATHMLGAPKDWNEARDGLCSVLPCRQQDHGGQPSFVSAWFPTPEELARLVAGAPVHLHVIGAGHPPVAVEVGNAPE